MKKVLAILLAMTLVFSMSSTVLAADVTGDTEKDITVTVTAGKVNNVRSIIIDWESLTFSYTKGDKTWNPGTQSYDEANGAWGANGNTAVITVTNKSDVAIAVGATIEGQKDNDGFKAELSTSSLTLENYAKRTANNPDVQTITVTVGLDANEGEPTTCTVGAVKLTIS